MGCLKSTLAGIGCLVVLLAAAAAAYLYRDRLAHLYRRFRGIPEPTPVVYVLPSPGGAARAETALRQLASRGGPAYVDIAPGDLAALLDRELARGTSRVFDSVAVALGEQRLLVKGSLDVSGLPRRLLGPLSEGLGRREPMVAGGPLSAGPDGRVRWTIDELTIRAFSFPPSVIPAIIRSFHVAEARDASVPIPVPAAIGDVRVSPSGVRVYRASPR